MQIIKNSLTSIPALQTITASLASIPTFYFRAVRATRLLGEDISNVTMHESLKRGLFAAPVVAAYHFADQIAHKVLRQKITGQPGSLASDLCITVFASPVSILANAVFNGQILGLTVKETIRLLSAKQIALLFFMRVGQTCGSHLFFNFKFKQKAPTEYDRYFMSVCFAIILHPCVSALTLWQKGKNVESLSQLMRGVSWAVLSSLCSVTCVLCISRIFEAFLAKKEK